MLKTNENDSMGIHPSSRMEIARKKIEALGLAEEESRMIDAIDILMRQYSENSTEDREKRFENFERSIKPYFEEMISEHLVSINTGLNQFLGQLQKEHITPQELKKSIEDLMQIVNSDAIEEVKQFSPEQLKSLHDSIVNPLKEHIVEGINGLQSDLVNAHDNLIIHTKSLAQQLSDKIQSSKTEIKESVGAVKSKIDAMKVKRTLQ